MNSNFALRKSYAPMIPLIRFAATVWLNYRKSRGRTFTSHVLVCAERLERVD